MPENPITPMLSEDELAERWNLTRRTLYNWRTRGEPMPPHVVLADGRLRYRVKDVEAFEESRLSSNLGGDRVALGE